MQANCEFIKSVIDYKIAFFFSFVLSSLCSCSKTVFVEFVQGPRKKQRAGMHLFQCYVFGSDCDCAMFLTSHFILFIFIFYVQTTLWAVPRMASFFLVSSLRRKSCCAGSHQSLAGGWRWKVLKPWWDFGAAVVRGFRSLEQHVAIAISICLGILT